MNITAESLTVMVAMVCLTVLAVANFYFTGQDGVVLMSVASLIAGIVGYKTKEYKVNQEAEKNSS